MLTRFILQSCGSAQEHGRIANILIASDPVWSGDVLLAVQLRKDNRRED